MSLVDKLLQCLDFGTNFTFIPVEQKFFPTKVYTNEPKRSPFYPQAKRAEHNSGFGNFSSLGFSRQMFSAVCAECGIQTQVPFEPRGERLVYCNDCYRKVRTSR